MKTFRYSALISSLLVVNLLTAFGQNKFAFSVNIAPVYAHSDFSTVAPYSTPNSTVTLTKYAGNANGLNYSIGLMGWYNFSPKWSASVGIWATHPVTNKLNVTYNGVPSSMTYQYNHPFANLYKVPLLVNYQSSLKKLSPYFSAGVSFDFRGISYVDLNGNGEYVAVKFGKAVALTPLVGVGLIYGLTNHLSLLAQPTFQYDLQTRPSYDYYHLYQLSLQTQLIWHL